MAPPTTPDLPSRKNSPLALPADVQRHRARQHSQGFFEPSLPTASFSDQSSMANLTASQIAAQAAMQHQSMAQHIRKRSQTVPNPQFPIENPNGGRMPTSPPPTQDNSRKQGSSTATVPQYHNGLLGGLTTAATTAANAAFPRHSHISGVVSPSENQPEKEQKLKSERSKIKLFSKPKHIAINRDKDQDRNDRPLGSPNKIGPPGPSGLSKTINASTTSLADSTTSGSSSLYTAPNASTSTLVPLDRLITFEKEKAHKHHFLSRQKHKLKDKDDHHNLPLSSASSNSKPLDPHAPQSLYSFAPSSPSAASFAKSMSGLDLRHGGRALREKKKEEKASAAATASASGLDTSNRELETSNSERAEWLGSSSLPSTAGQNLCGAPTASNASIFGGIQSLHGGDALSQTGLQGFGLTGMTPDDAWDFLKAKLLIVFEGEDLRLPVEDFNRLVSVHIQRCVQKRAPTIIMEDLHELLHTGFSSLEHNLRGIPDERLVPHLVDMWLFVFGTILPYMQAVFLPLDLEFKGHGSIMTSREAAEFWGATLNSSDDALGNELDVRRIVLVSYRDTVILPRYESLKAIFSRLSLESINAGFDLSSTSPDGGRPGTAASLDPGLASFNSQDSTLLGDSEGARSRATSNTSAPDFPSFRSPRSRPVMDSAKVTEMVGRMLQCVSVLASVQSGDDAQDKMEGLSKELKHNWLGRGRTGRNRRGFVGTRIRPAREGSPTPTPSAVEGRRDSML
ncbi:MAG: hypothetical protein M1830_002987 [Pleopsidium flavum]|nr:MAG: hypothetical protein M1830_002987 [Pleopsidium flavum]